VSLRLQAAFEPILARHLRESVVYQEQYKMRIARRAPAGFLRSTEADEFAQGRSARRSASRPPWMELGLKDRP